MNNSSALNTLFHLFESGLLPWPEKEQRCLFLNAQTYKALSHFPKETFTAQQFFLPYAEALKSQSYNVQPAPPEQTQQFDMAMLVAPKNQIETLHLIATALQSLKPDGLLVVAAENKAGGGRLVKNLKSFGLSDIQSDTRNKCRACWTVKDTVDNDAIDAALKRGQPQSIDNGAFQSWPGIYGWNKIDTGSRILLQHLPKTLKGKGADFGCGYGLLSHHVLQHCDVQSLTCIDADWRCLKMCRANLEQFEDKANIHFKWADLTKQPPGFSNLDFIIMNPPFHEGKAAYISIGQRFIETAYTSLKRGGTLWMVANRHLAYEHTLEEGFFKVEKVFEEQGFKVFYAIK